MPKATAPLRLEHIVGDFEAVAHGLFDRFPHRLAHQVDILGSLTGFVDRQTVDLFAEVLAEDRFLEEGNADNGERGEQTPIKKSSQQS